MIDPVWFLLACAFFLGALAALIVIDLVRCLRRRARGRRPPVTKGQLHLFNDEGEGHFLSATLSSAGLEQLLKDVNQGRFG